MYCGTYGLTLIITYTQMFSGVKNILKRSTTQKSKISHNIDCKQRLFHPVIKELYRRITGQTITLLQVCPSAVAIFAPWSRRVESVHKFTTTKCKAESIHNIRWVHSILSLPMCTWQSFRKLNRIMPYYSQSQSLSPYFVSCSHFSTSRHQSSFNIPHKH